MSLRINHNISSINGHRNMVKNDGAVSKSLERLSSGLRINRASDDAAGLIISEQMRAQITGLKQAMANAEQAVTLVQTAEGAMDEMSNLLNKARQLALHASNDGLNDTNQLVADQTELDNLIDSLDRIANNTQFGTKRLLDGSLSTATSNNSAISSVKLGGDYQTQIANGNAVKGYHTLQITQVATQAQASLDMSAASDIWSGGSLAGALGDDVAQDTFTLAVNGATITVTSGQTKNQFLQQLNALGQRVGFTAYASGSVTGAAGSGAFLLTARDFGSSTTFNAQFVSGASGASSLASTLTVGLDAKATLYLYSGSAGVGGTAGTGGTTIDFTATGNGTGLRLASSGGSTIVLSTAVGISTGASSGFLYGAVNGTQGGATFQVGANVSQVATVAVQAMQSTQLGIGGSGTYQSLAQIKGSAFISGNAQEALRVIDKSIDDITTQRGVLGAFQSSTLETTVNNMRITSENLTAAESTIRDVDFAEESAQFTRNNILVQAATAMMSQANQLPQNVLKLLQ